MNFIRSLIGSQNSNNIENAVSDTNNITNIVRTTDSNNITDVVSIKTENGALSNATTGSELLNLSFKTVRGIETGTLNTLLAASWKESELLTAKYIFHCRDCRGGKGERQIFRDCLCWLAVNKPFVIRKNIHLIPVYGRWDDLFTLLPFKDLWNLAWRLIKKQLDADLSISTTKESISLLAKWMPREGGSLDKKTGIVAKLCAHFKWTPRQYRSRISKLSKQLDVPELKMCAGDWTDINYSGVPSQCMLRMRKAFARHDEAGFKAFLDAVKSGAKTIKAGQLDVHQMVKAILASNNNRSLISDEESVIEAQWIEKMKTINRLDNCLAVVDVSGSMAGTPMEVSIAMGMVVAEKSSGAFKDVLITFESRPKLHQIKGETLTERVRDIRNMPWGGSTNFQAVFDLILTRAITQEVPDSEMPRTLFVFSDMQFDQADENPELTNLEAVRSQYQAAGYTIPNMVFWNLRANTIDYPSVDENGVIMLSGYNTALLQYILEGKTPSDLLLSILNSDRYAPISL